MPGNLISLQRQVRRRLSEAVCRAGGRRARESQISRCSKAFFVSAEGRLGLYAPRVNTALRDRKAVVMQCAR